MFDEPVDVPYRIVKPFQAHSLPIIAKLANLGFHQYTNRWAKRLFKRPGRAVFDIAYDRLQLGGQGRADLLCADAKRHFTFNARHLHFAPVYLSRFRFGYEPEVSILFDLLLKGEGTVLDIGANWGYFSFFIASRPHFNGVVHAFEPVADTFSCLLDITTQLGLSRQIICHNLALSNKEGMGTMMVDNKNTGIARLVDDHDNHDQSMEVQLACIDNMSLPEPFFVKLDVEGHEADVLEGGRHTFETARPFLTIENWFDAREPDTSLRPLRFLESIEYVLLRPMWRSSTGFVDINWKSNVIFGQSPDAFISFIPFNSKERSVFSDQINVFACPEERLQTVRDAARKMSLSLNRK